MNLTKKEQDLIKEQIAEDLISDSDVVRKVAKKRMKSLEGEEPNIEVFEEKESIDWDAFKEKVGDIVSKQSAIVNPAFVLKQGVVYTAEDVQEINQEEQLQQVGIDLRLAKAFRVVGNATLSVDKNRTKKPELIEMQQTAGYYLFKAGELYSIDFLEDVKVPEDMAAIVKHRSTINRTIGTIESGWYDPGFESSGGCGAVFRPNTDVRIEVGFRCAQIVFYTATSANLYNGQYQKS